MSLNARIGGGVVSLQTKTDEIGLNRVVGCEMRMQKCLTHPAMLESVPRKFLVLCVTSHQRRTDPVGSLASCAGRQPAHPVRAWAPWADVILPGPGLPDSFHCTLGNGMNGTAW
jgi:hypothetical protein